MTKAMTLRDQLRTLHRERAALLRSLSGHAELAIGSVSLVRRKCGRPTCHCTRDPGHPQTLFLFRGTDGQRHCKLVRREDEVRLHRAGKLYRDFRAALRRLRAINQREEAILVALAEERALSYE